MFENLLDILPRHPSIHRQHFGIVSAEVLMANPAFQVRRPSSYFSDMDSDKSVSTTKEVMQLIPDGHPTDKVIYLSLGDLLIMLSEHSGTLADWTETR